jgi:hypothetical protein
MRQSEASRGEPGTNDPVQRVRPRICFFAGVEGAGENPWGRKMVSVYLAEAHRPVDSAESRIRQPLSRRASNGGSIFPRSSLWSGPIEYGRGKPAVKYSFRGASVKGSGGVSGKPAAEVAEAR